MKLNFCTLFNSNYLTRGLAMYDSLAVHCPQFHLFIFTFDDKAADILKTLNLPDITVITLAEFEDEELLAIKPDRSPVEYCWTCTPSTILYCIQKFDLDHCTYIDADLLFYSNPDVLIREMGEKSVLIIDHRYTPEYDQTATSGKYCVQFMCFKNNEDGLHVLRWWRNACNEWCYARFEDGKFGDQKYLDDWPVRFTCVHELENIGGGVAPWNMQQYEFHHGKRSINLSFQQGVQLPLVFYHFHGVLLCERRIVRYCPEEYEIPEFVKKKIYYPYFIRLDTWQKHLKSIDPFFNPAVSPYYGGWLYTPKDLLKMYIKALVKLEFGRFSRIRKKLSEQEKLNFVPLSKVLLSRWFVFRFFN